MKTKLLSIIIVLFTLTSNAQTYMYGTTSEGGSNNLGTIYRVDQNGQNFQKVFDFSTSTGGNPFGGLTLANGKLYGFTTTDGQITNQDAVIALGTFYEFDPLTNTLSVIEYIDDQSSIGNGFNHAPTLHSNGKLYFVSSSAGLGNLDGILSSFDPTNSTIAVLGTLDGFYGQPISKLLAASDGNLYITTATGATNGYGAIVQFDVTNEVLNRIHVSEGGGQGQYNNARNNPLFEASNGVLYGCSQGGGTGINAGVLFKINKDGTGYQSLFAFVAGVADQGFYPQGGFIEYNGKLYSSTPQEEVVDVNSGTIFAVNLANDDLSFIHTLDLEGSQPRGVFTESPNGRFYLTCSGGLLNNGSLIEYNPLNGNVTQRHLFSPSNGTKPQFDELAVVDFSNLSNEESSFLDKVVKTYPNPVQDIINIKSDGSHQVETIKILDLKGSELYIDNSKTNETVINASFLSSGVYLLYIQTNSGSTTRKIIKE